MRRRRRQGAHGIATGQVGEQKVAAPWPPRSQYLALAPASRPSKAHRAERVWAGLFPNFHAKIFKESRVRWAAGSGQAGSGSTRRWRRMSMLRPWSCPHRTPRVPSPVSHFLKQIIEQSAEAKHALFSPNLFAERREGPLRAHDTRRHEEAVEHGCSCAMGAVARGGARLCPHPSLPSPIGPWQPSSSPAATATNLAASAAAGAGAGPSAVCRIVCSSIGARASAQPNVQPYLDGGLGGRLGGRLACLPALTQPAAADAPT